MGCATCGFSVVDKVTRGGKTVCIFRCCQTKVTSCPKCSELLQMITDGHGLLYLSCAKHCVRYYVSDEPKLKELAGIMRLPPLEAPVLRIQGSAFSF